MRTQRRPLAVAATIATALFGVALVAGASPAAAAAPSTTAAVSDCGTSSVGADGMLDADLLQACLDQVQASLSFGPPDEAAPADEAVVEEEPAAAPAAPVYDTVYEALDAVFSVVEPEPAAAAEEIAPVDSGLGDAFAALADCESGGDYSINTGNGYYGAYQFSLETWQSLGYGGYPHEASPAVQDQAARELQSLYGWGQWPGCSWYLGL
jgi:hypothetical protein